MSLSHYYLNKLRDTIMVTAELEKVVVKMGQLSVIHTILQKGTLCGDKELRIKVESALMNRPPRE